MLDGARNDKFFRTIYDQSFSMLLRVSVRIVLEPEVAEELCHDAFIKLYARLDQFPDVDQAKYWLIRVVKNQSLNHAKRVQRERRAYERVFVETRKHTEAADVPMVRADTGQAVRAALAELPPAMRDILIMKEYAEMSYKDIAQALGITETNVKVRMFRARKKLGQLLEDSHGA